MKYTELFESLRASVLQKIEEVKNSVSLDEGPHQPKSEGEKRFMALHRVTTKGHPVSTDDQHTATSVTKDKSKLASYHEGDDEEAYNAAQGIKPAADAPTKGARGKVNEGRFKDIDIENQERAEREQERQKKAPSALSRLVAAAKDKKKANSGETQTKKPAVNEGLRHFTDKKGVKWDDEGRNTRGTGRGDKDEQAALANLKRVAADLGGGKLFFDVPFSQREAAKKEGMEFSSALKLWYHTDKDRAAKSKFKLLTTSEAS
ncbi:MAG: hypothetical protein DDT26_00303 [Dehalococcoidia bacterium]|nr:hypothetical protein [Chloroflexota bacterium]